MHLETVNAQVFIAASPALHAQIPHRRRHGHRRGYQYRKAVPAGPGGRDRVRSGSNAPGEPGQTLSQYVCAKSVQPGYGGCEDE